MSDAPYPREPIPLRATGDDEGKQIAVLLETARSLVAEEFQRSERLDAKARNQFTVVGALFAVVMATTAGVLNALLDQRDPVARWIYPALGSAAVASIVFLFLALLGSAWAWRLHQSDALDPATLGEFLPHAERGKLGVSKELVRAYERVLTDRRAKNKRRAKDLKRASVLALLAGGCSLAQLAAVFIALITQ